MRGVFVFALLFVMIIGLASAEYGCSDGSSMNKTSEEISLGNAEVVNGASIGLAKSEGSIESYVELNVFLEVKEFVLTSNATNTSKFNGEDYDIKLLNSSDNDAKIDIDGESATIEEKEIGTLNGLEVMVDNAQGTFLDSPSVSLLIGANKTIITNTKNQDSRLVSIGSKEYLIELLSATDRDAYLMISKCNSGSIVSTINQVNNASDNETLNQSNNSSPEFGLNETADNSTLNETANTTDAGAETNNDVAEEQSQDNSNWLYYVIIAVVVIIVLFFIIKFGRKSTAAPTVNAGVPDAQRKSLDSMQSSTNQEPDEEN